MIDNGKHVRISTYRTLIASVGQQNSTGNELDRKTELILLTIAGDMTKQT